MGLIVRWSLLSGLYSSPIIDNIMSNQKRELGSCPYFHCCGHAMANLMVQQLYFCVFCVVCFSGRKLVPPSFWLCPASHYCTFDFSCVKNASSKKTQKGPFDLDFYPCDFDDFFRGTR